MPGSCRAHMGITMARQREGRMIIDYVRRRGLWIKITRDNQKKRFTFARGYEGHFKAVEVTSWPFTLMTTWNDAVEHANRTIDTYAPAETGANQKANP